MATDRYSNNHNIVVKNGTGELSIDGNLAVAGNVSTDGDLEINSQDILINTSEDITVLAGKNINVSSGNTISSGSLVLSADNTRVGLYPDLNSVVIKNGSQEVSAVTDNIIISSSSDLGILSSDDISIYGGTGSGGNGYVKISANNGFGPYISLTESTTSIDLVADSVNISQSPKTVETSIPGVSFLIFEKYDSVGGNGDESTNAYLQTGDEFRHTENGNIYWGIDTYTAGFVYAHIFAPLPCSIPDGSIVTHIGASLDLDRDGAFDNQVLNTKVMIKRYPIAGSSTTTIAEEEVSYYLDGYKTFLYECTQFTIDRANYTYTIRVRFKLEKGGAKKHVYLTAGRIKYTTTKFDPNI